ncbi:serine--tRNA ligase [Sandaracinobacteroides saxicola]|uniref:Serine--tRNA ligase n=1 Tax=Sandaracinobacteroides saxicola TaxID=2759707 RepID=A0A7G5IGR3_9SPHN|nr:serine--tRNA ligase [Sandaracinobacteroides saxicola]QMW22555.1 serine--tRNA ligase [Sandaracinobacteroides saxicola]
MHDIKAIRADPAWFDTMLARRNIPSASKSIIESDARVKIYETQNQEQAAQKNQIAKAVGQAKASGDTEALQQRLEDARLHAAMSESIGELIAEHSKSRDDLLAALPNLPADDVPDGADESGNVELKRWGTPRQFDFAPRDHDAVAARLGYDPEAAAAIAGARFAILRGGLARLHRALGQFMLDTHTRQFGYTETIAPLLVRSEAMFGTAQLPKFRDDQFETTDGRWLIPTAEVSLTNQVREQILDGERLPLRFTALTPCFRKEAGAAGRDTRGLIRQHQFEKVELVSITRPEDSDAEHERMTRAAESILEALNLPYRRMILCAGDMGFAARRTFDLEVWLPGAKAYREISSCSTCGDFQARRMEARFRTKGEKGTRFVHTLNGSGLAVGRALVAVIENYQTADGAVMIPDVLAPYMGGLNRLEPES